MKNALDTVWAEWNDKPVLVVSYGGHGGARSAAALVRVLQTLKAKQVEPGVAMTIARDDYAPDGSLANPCGVVEKHRAELEVGLAALHSALGC